MISLIISKLESIGANYTLKKYNEGYWVFNIEDCINFLNDCIIMFTLLEIEKCEEDFFEITFNSTVRFIYTNEEEFKKFIEEMEWEY